MKPGFDAVVDGEHLRSQNLGAIAANQNLHRLFVHFLPDLMDIAFRDQDSRR